MKCFDALLQQDTREIFILEGYKLKIYMDELCVAMRTDDIKQSDLVVMDFY